MIATFEPTELPGRQSVHETCSVFHTVMMSPLVSWTIAVIGSVLLCLVRDGEPFTTLGRSPLAQNTRHVQGFNGGARSSEQSCGSRVLCVLDEYQENPEGLVEGDFVKIVAKGIKFFHVRSYKEGFDPEGSIGEVTWLKLMSRKYEGQLVTANRPVMVAFQKPVSFKAHFEFGEVSKLSEDELKDFQEKMAAEEEAAAAMEATE